MLFQSLAEAGLTLPKKQLDKEDLSREYSEKCPKYERLADNLKQALKRFLNDADIDVLDVVCRTKDFDSFCEKIERKDYTDPFLEMEDICGLRIICYYPSDLERISQIINNEFEVLESIDTADLLEPDRFGYRSLHFVVAVKKDWLKAPNYRGLGGLKAEIQVRTILMHAWADIEHKLAYKKREHIPDPFKRKLSRLSALVETADEQFDNLRQEINAYIGNLISQEVRESGRFDVNQEMNLDSVQAFLDFYFPDRRGGRELTSDLLDTLLNYDISFADLLEGVEKTKHILLPSEIDYFGKGKEGKGWAQVGVVRHILDLTNDDYWQNRRLPSRVRRHVEKWRAKLSERNR